MRAIVSAGGLLALLVLGFFVYDILDFVIGAWIVFAAVIGFVAARLFGWLPGMDTDLDV
jgi:hypothetical protein